MTDKCWCESGKLAENCCAKSGRPPKFNHRKISNTFKKTCLHGSCNQPIINSHSIPESQLKMIAKDGHVYNFAITSDTLINITSANSNQHPILLRKGINEANTFKGFCAQHDMEIFKNIDKALFHEDPANIFLTNYRAVCFGQRSHEIGLAAHIKYEEEVAPHYPIVDKIRLKQTIEKQRLAKSIDWNYLVSKYNKSYQSGNYSNLEYLILYIKRAPWFLCNGFDGLLYTFESDPVIGFDPENPASPAEEICCSVQPISDGGLIIFSHLNENRNDYFKQFVNSMHPENSIDFENRLLSYVFLNYSNIAVSPVVNKDFLVIVDHLLTLGHLNKNPKKISFHPNLRSFPELELLKYKCRLIDEVEVEVIL